MNVQPSRPPSKRSAGNLVFTMRYVRSWLVCVFLLFGSIPVPAQPCGPGPHWVDGCAAGTDSVITGALIGVNLAPNDCALPPDANLVLFELEQTIVERGDPVDIAINGPGCIASVDGHNDVIATEIICMTLAAPPGYVLTVGAGKGQGGVLPASTGYIVELAGDSTLACSFFDVYFEILVPGFGYLYNQDPLRLSAIIDRVPPDTIYFHADNLCVDLYTEPTMGVVVATLVEANHIVGSDELRNFLNSIPTVSEWGLIILALLIVCVGTIVIRQMRGETIGLQGAGASLHLSTIRIPFELRPFLWVLAAVMLLALAAFFILTAHFGKPSGTDIVGALLCIPIIAYWIHLLPGARR